MKGAILSIEKDREETILELFKKGLAEGIFDTLLIPLKVPAGDSFAYVLLKNQSLLDRASPLPPVMPVQGAKALSSLTGMGKSNQKIAAVMRPCEISAAIELYKLKQIDLDNIFLVSIDCPGVLQLSDFIKDPEKGIEKFTKTLDQWGSDFTRPVCKICTEFGMPSSDLHIGLLGSENKSVFLIPGTEKGKEILERLDILPKNDMENWETQVKDIRDKRENKRNMEHKELKSEIEGPDKLLEIFSKCVNCRNCMRVCPICYCRECYFNSDALKLYPENYMVRAKNKGGLRLPPDTLLFHLGRMSHMIFSCVSCGSCEDACPVSIPVAQIFSMVADETQKLFNYVPGRSIDEPLPLATYKEEEFREIETPYVETYQSKEIKSG
jgi:formate dehydrogenase (coenzyme F420) beta subunit